MADASWHSDQMSNSAVIDMQDGDVDNSDYDTSFNDDQFKQRRDKGDETPGQPQQPQPDDGNFMGRMRNQLGQSVTGYFLQQGSQEAKKVYSVYGNIDILRPYFDVEPHQVRNKLLMSLIPSRLSDSKQRVQRELYGPLMVVFTLIALLLFQMKTSGHTVQEGTLMGTAFGTCFIYWIGGAWFIWFLSYVCNTHIAILQIMSMLGYGLFGHCVVLFLGTVIHTSHDHMLFYFLWALIGGLSTLKIVMILFSRTSGNTQRMIICAVVTAMHLMFLIYLHFAYHQIVEELSETLRGPDKFNPLSATVSAERVRRSIGAMSRSQQDIASLSVHTAS